MSKFCRALDLNRTSEFYGMGKDVLVARFPTSFPINPLSMSVFLLPQERMKAHLTLLRNLECRAGEERKM